MGLGALVKKYRKARGMNITKLAQVAGISRSYLSQIESGAKGPPSVKVLLRMAETLDIPIAEIIEISQSEGLPPNYFKELYGHNEINMIVQHAFYSTKDSADCTSKQMLENFQMSRLQDKWTDTSGIQKFNYNPTLIGNILLDLLNMGEQGQIFVKKQVEVYKELFIKVNI